MAKRFGIHTLLKAHSTWGALASAALLALVATPVGAVPPGYTLNWADEFSGAVGSGPDAAFWNYNTGAGGWGNNELQNYVTSLANCQIVSDGGADGGKALRIRAEKDSAGNYYSARINTAGKVIPTYGYVEGRCRVPAGAGLWPAFWMIGNNFGSVGWPACGELDIMEWVGYSPATVYSSFHATGWDAMTPYNNPGGYWFSDTYHTFSMNWTPNCISYYVDGVHFMTRTVNDSANWPFNLPQFFILNLAVGGSWPGNPDANTVFPANYYVDYIRVYKMTGVPSGRTVSLFSLANNKFVCAENAGASALSARSTSAGGWEQFQVVDLGSGNVALKSLANGNYVCAENAGAGNLIARSTAVGTWETFKWEAHTDGSVSLKAAANNQYVCTDLNAGTGLISNRASAGGWESYCVTVY